MSVDRLVPRRRRVAELAGPAVVVAVIWAVVSLGWLGRAATEAESEVDALAAERLALVEELSTLERLEAERSAMAAEEARLDAAVPATPALDVFVDDLAAAAVAAGVEIEQFAPISVSSALTDGGTDLPDGVTAIELSVTAVGDYRGLMRLLAEVEAFDRLVLVDSISLLADDDVVDQVTLDVVLRVFTLAEAASTSGLDSFDDPEFDDASLDDADVDGAGLDDAAGLDGETAAGATR